MPRNRSRSLVLAFAAGLGLWVFLGQTQEAAATLSYRGLWEARENEEGRVLQQYDHLFGISAGQNLTERLSSTEKVNYNYRWEQEGVARRTVSPGASVSMAGDLLLGSLAVNSIRDLGSQKTQADSDTLGLTLASHWQKKMVPALRAVYDYTHRWDDSNNRRTDENRQLVGGEVDWDLRLAQAFYSYRHEDAKYTDNQIIQDTHLARLNIARVWLDNRLRVSLGHEYNQTGNERLVPFDSSTTAHILLNLTDFRTATDPTPADTDDSMFVADNPALHDGNLLLSAYPVSNPGNPNCLRILTNGQQVDRLYLYTQTNLGVAPLGLTWRVYSNNDPVLTPWAQQLAVTVSYDTINQRFVIDLPALKVNYLKVVVDLDVVAPVFDFTEVQCEQILHGTVGSTLSIKSENQSNKSNFNLDFRLNRTVALFYNLLLEKEESDLFLVNERENHNGGLRWQNSVGDLKSILSYGLTRQSSWASPESQTATYQLNINKIFLPTLSVAVGGAREEVSQAGSAISSRNRYTFYTDAKLYPDLNSQLEVIYWEQEVLHPGLASSLADSLHMQFTVTSRFRPSLSITFYDIYEDQSLDNQVTRNQNISGLSGSWQLSGWCSLRASGQMENNKLIHDAYTYSLGAVVGLTSSLELKADYSLHKAETMGQSGNAALRWSARRNISWEIGCDYAESEAVAVRNLYKVYSRLNVNFATH